MDIAKRRVNIHFYYFFSANTCYIKSTYNATKVRTILSFEAPILEHQLLGTALGLLGTATLSIGVSILATALLGTGLVKISLHSSARGRHGVFSCRDVFVASQAHRKHIGWLDAAVSTTQMDPLAVPTCRNDVLQSDWINAQITSPNFLAENGGLDAAQLGVRIVLV